MKRQATYLVQEEFSVDDAINGLSSSMDALVVDDNEVQQHSLYKDFAERIGVRSFMTFGR